MKDDTLYLTATDTTIGFVCQSAEKLNKVKQRLPDKHYIKAVDSLATLQRFSRAPTKYKRAVRRAKRTTFIMPHGRSFRVIVDAHHLLLLRRLQWAYTTSANLSGKAYDESFAKKAADVVIYPLRSNGRPSTILKLGKTRIRKVR